MFRLPSLLMLLCVAFQFHALYFVSFVVILLGLGVYSLSPASPQQARDNRQLTGEAITDTGQCDGDTEEKEKSQPELQTCAISDPTNVE